MTGDFGTPELRLRGNAVLEQGDATDITTRRMRVESSAIQWYAKRNYLNPKQVEAAEQYAKDAYLAGLDPKVTGSFHKDVNGAIAELTETRLGAQTRRLHAMQMLEKIKPSPQLRQMMDAVAIDGIAAGRYAMFHWGASPNEAMTMLESATTALARHFGLLR